MLETLLGATMSTTDTKTVSIPTDGALAKTLDGLTLDMELLFNRRTADASGVFYQSWAGVSHVLGKSSPASEKSIRDHCIAMDGAPLHFWHENTRDTMNEALWVTAPFASTSLDDNGHVVESPSDGMVSVESAKWGLFRGCIPADHYDVIGQIGHLTRDGQTGFDAIDFYRFVASDLAARGF